MSSRRWHVTLGVMLVCMAGCTIPTGEDSADVPTVDVTMSTPSATDSPAIPSPVSPSVVAAPPWTADFRRDFDMLAKTTPGSIGIAIAAVGTVDVQLFGSLTVGSAWSTIKVPLSLAAERRSGSEVSAAVTDAIVESDNAAAELLWESLGDSESAADAVTAILRESGDTDTVVPTTRTRSEYSIFGQTQWPLDKQAAFVGHLPCMSGSAHLLNSMGTISPGQSWGLGMLDSQFKGGWGPDASSGGYLVRQLGIVMSANGATAVAVAAQPDSGLFDDGVRQVDALAGFIGDYADVLPAGRCAS